MANISLATAGRLAAEVASRVTSIPKQCGSAAWLSKRRLVGHGIFFKTILAILCCPRRLAVEVKMNPDKRCNFDCGYWEGNRETPGHSMALDVDGVAAELVQTQNLVQ